MSLTIRQTRFIDEYLIDYNGTQAAIRAGYSKLAAKEQASRLLTNANVKALIDQKNNETEIRLQISRDDIIKGLLGTIELARSQSKPLAMISACREMAKMLGYYNTPTTENDPEASSELVQKVNNLSDNDLEELVLSLESAARATIRV